MKKAILIYNPLSGARFISLKLDNIIGKFQEKDILIQPYMLKGQSYSEIIEIFRKENYDFVVVAGGDGSVNFVANILMKGGIDIPLGIIPAGTCNDFAACIGIPSKFESSLDTILKGKLRTVDVGLLNGEKYFLNTYAAGVFVDVSFNTANELKKNLGPFAYYIKAFSEVKNIKSFKLTIEMKDETVVEEAILFFIINGKNAGGFPNLIKRANIADGVMDMVIVKKCSHIDLMSLFFKILNGVADKDPNVVFLRAKKCTIRADREIQVTIDGEKGESLPVVVEVMNRSLRVYCK